MWVLNEIERFRIRLDQCSFFEINKLKWSVGLKKVEFLIMIVLMPNVW